MPSLGIALAAKGGRGEPVRPGHDGHRYQVPSSDRSKLLPLKIGVQTIKSSPYRAGLPAHRPEHLDPATGFLPCSGPHHLSDPGKASDPADLPSSLSRLRRGCVSTPRGALVVLHGEQMVGPAAGEEVRVGALAAQRIDGDHGAAQVSDGVQHGAKAASSYPPDTWNWDSTRPSAWSKTATSSVRPPRCSGTVLDVSGSGAVPVMASSMSAFALHSRPGTVRAAGGSFDGPPVHVAGVPGMVRISQRDAGVAGAPLRPVLTEELAGIALDRITA